MKQFSQFAGISSLSTRLKLLTLLWGTAALVAIMFTLLLSWRLDRTSEFATAAGSLKVHAYHAAYLVNQQGNADDIRQEILALDEILHGLRPQNDGFLSSLLQDQRIYLQTKEIEREWRLSIRPLLKLQHLPDHLALKRFIGGVELLVDHLAENSKINTVRLRYFQTILIIMVLMVVGLSVFLLNRWVISPLTELQKGVEAIRSGMFGTEIALHSSSEFRQLGKGFNHMSTHLKTLYTDLEGQVSRQTEDLAHKNHELELMFETIRDLHQSHTPTIAAEKFLTRVLPAVAAPAGSIRLLDFERKRTDLVASIGLPNQISDAEKCRELENCLCGNHLIANQKSDQAVCFFDVHDFRRLSMLGNYSAGFDHVAVFPILYKEEELGIFTLYFSDGHRLSQRENELLQTLSRQLGVSIANSRFAQESKQLAVLQERNLIAQGLHDSIAQTLTFLNLQVQMLESAVDEQNQEQIDENIRFLKSGVQECYDDVRELLLNFRTKISNKDFPDAVNTLLRRFEQQTQVKTDILWRDTGPSLNNDEQLQAIFILQESLSNIRKHAHARNVYVEISNEHDFVLTIKDDGVGFDTGRLKNISSGHVGLSIMQERAGRIQATLDVESAIGKGTVITLTLPQQKRTAS